MWAIILIVIIVLLGDLVVHDPTTRGGTGENGHVRRAGPDRIRIARNAFSGRPDPRLRTSVRVMGLGLGVRLWRRLREPVGKPWRADPESVFSVRSAGDHRRRLLQPSLTAPSFRWTERARRQPGRSPCGDDPRARYSAARRHVRRVERTWARFRRYCRVDPAGQRAQARRHSVAVLGPRQSGARFRRPARRSHGPGAGEGKIRPRIRRVPGRRVLVFVHGFNTRFEEAVYRFAQIVHDARVHVAPVLFTWPSGGRLTDYVYDRDSALYSRDALEAVLQALVNDPNVDSISILAHSMGNYIAMESLRQMSIRDRRLSPKIRDVMLASPDIDVDVFRRQIAEIDAGPRPAQFTLFISRDDRALGLSSFLARRLDPARLARSEQGALPFDPGAGQGAGRRPDRHRPPATLPTTANSPAAKSSARSGNAWRRGSRSPRPRAA